MRISLAGVVVVLAFFTLGPGPFHYASVPHIHAAVPKREEIKPPPESTQEDSESPASIAFGAKAPRQEHIDPPADEEAPRQAGIEAPIAVKSLAQSPEVSVKPTVTDPQPPDAPITADPLSDDPCAGLTAEQRKTIPMCEEHVQL
jgi:hypothetical protein